MARIRSIKPSFFADVDVAQLPFEQRILFIGLWCLADRRGRLQDEPRTIKQALFSSDLSDINKKVDVEKILQELTRKPFIVRYEVERKRYIQVVNFDDHQQPHFKEPESKIPEPGASTVQAPCEPGASTIPAVQEGKGAVNRKGKEGNGIYACFEQACLNHWSLFCEKYPSLSKIQQVTDTRRKHLKERFEEAPFRDFEAILKAIEEQPFLIHGNKNNEQHKHWRIDFDWIIKNDQNYVKILERRYKDKNAIPTEKPDPDCDICSGKGKIPDGSQKGATCLCVKMR